MAGLYCRCPLLRLQRNLHPISKKAGCTNISPSTANEGTFIPSQPYQHLLLYDFCMIVILTGVRQNLTVVTISSYFMTSQPEHFFMCRLAISISSFRKCLEPVLWNSMLSNVLLCYLRHPEILVLVNPLVIQLSANTPQKTVVKSSRAWGPSPMWEKWKMLQVPSFHLAQLPPLISQQILSLTDFQVNDLVLKTSCLNTQPIS